MKNSIEIYQNLTPEYDGEEGPTMNIDNDSVSFSAPEGGGRISLTRLQFKDAMRYFRAYETSEEIFNNQRPKEVNKNGPQ